MAQFIMVACDLHDKTMLLKIAEDRNPAETISVPNTRAGRTRMIADLLARAAALRVQKARRDPPRCCDLPFPGFSQRVPVDLFGREAAPPPKSDRGSSPSAAEEKEEVKILFAYEASGQGFELYDELTAAGIECYVLAPTKMARSVQHARNKTDEKDTDHILQLLRGHVLAGNPLPTVWVPDPATRDDREVVRLRLDAAEKVSAVKTQIQSLLKRHALARPDSAGQNWTRLFWAWLRGVCGDESQGPGLRETLTSLLRQLEFLEAEVKRLDQALLRLAQSPRYEAAVNQLVQQLAGVGVLTALVFLTELGDLRRFVNRRQIGAYLGLIPQCYESGSASDRKGHITRQGPSRVRRMLCQAAWARIRSEGLDRAAYRRIVERNPKRKKIAAVAVMRRLAVRMWHQAREVQPQRDGSSTFGGPRSNPRETCAPPLQPA